MPTQQEMKQQTDVDRPASSSGGIGKTLHDQATRGKTRTRAEQADLDAWYARQDAEEDAALARSAAGGNQAELRALVEQTLFRVAQVTRQIQSQADENERLRAEIAELQQRLPSTPESSPV